MAMGCYVAFHWQSNVYFEARWKKIRRAYSSPMQTNRFKGNSKAKTIPPGSLSVYSDERLKDCLKRIFRNPRTMVPNGEKCQMVRCAPIDLQIDLDIRSWLGEADCIANDVFTGASKSMWIGIPENDRTPRTESDRLA